jgi:hypothetical protein
MTPRSFLTLRNLLLIDAATCSAMGGLLVLGSAPVGQLTQIPSSLLFYVGLSLFPIAAFMAFVAARPVSNPTATWLIIIGNGLWVVGSVLLLTSGWIAPNYLGFGFIAAQAVLVALLATLEHRALRESLLQPRAV